MSNLQCSMCLETYSFNEYMKLETEWVDPNNKKQYGKRAICKCKAVFHKDRWGIQSRKQDYIISTVHLEMGATSIVDWSDLSDYFYETMIFRKDQLDLDNGTMGKPLDFCMRYKTKEEAIQGHKDTYDKLEQIILDPTKYPMGVIPMFCNLMGAVNDQKKNIHHTVKERLT